MSHYAAQFRHNKNRAQCYSFYSIFFWALNNSINSILPHLYRDPANASPDGSVSLFLMTDSKTTGGKERRGNRERGLLPFLNN